MTSQPLVTIGAINYNNGLYVIETLESIKAQSYPNVELVIVDDCSTDNSATLIADWLNSYNKPFKFIKHPKNLGVCATCNDVLKNASGKYISIIATDDIMMDEKIEVQVNILENSTDDVGAVYSDAYLIKEDSSPRYGWFIQRHEDFDQLPSGNIYETLLKGNFIPAMSLLVKKSCYIKIGFFDENLIFEDFDMWLRLSKAYNILYSEYVSIKYRVRSNSLTRTIKNWDHSYLDIYIKNLKSPIALAKIQRMTMVAYEFKDRKFFTMISKQLLKNKKIKYIFWLFKLRIPFFVGRRILRFVNFN